MMWLKRTLPLWLVGLLLTSVWLSSSLGQMSVSGPLSFPSGTAALPGAPFAASTGTGMWRPEADIIAFSTGSVERIRCNASGNCGVNNTAPNHLWDIKKTTGASVFGAPYASIGETEVASVGNLSTIGFGFGSSTANPAVEFGAIMTTATNFGIHAFIVATRSVDTNTAASERLRVDGIGNLGLATTSPTNLVSLGGNAARTAWMERHTTADTAGNNLTIQAGGATSAATNKNAGDLILAPGTATGTGKSKVIIQSVLAGSTGTADRAPATHFQVADGHLESLGTAPGTLTAGCGSTASIAGTDVMGTITLGGTGITAVCGFTFATTWTNIPKCVADDVGASVAAAYGIQAVETTTTATFNKSPSATAFVGPIRYSCVGRA